MVVGKTYSGAGNIRAVSKSTLCNMFVNAWKDLDNSIIVKSFECCSLDPNPVVDKMTCCKDGCQSATGRVVLREALETPLERRPITVDVIDYLDNFHHEVFVFGDVAPTVTVSTNKKP